MNLYQAAKILAQKAQADAPSYRPAGDKEDRCATCLHNPRGQWCDLFSFVLDPEYVCDDFDPRRIPQELRSEVKKKI